MSTQPNAFQQQVSLALQGQGISVGKIVDQQSVASLWSGYGEIVRLRFSMPSSIPSVVVKSIHPPVGGAANRRGWSGSVSHQRKLRSYEVESNWYRDWSQRCVTSRVPTCYAVETVDGGQRFLLEDLDASGYPIRKGVLEDRRLKACLSWLAKFHAEFLHAQPAGLWSVGTYWHLATRPDEWKAMADGPLKRAAEKIDQRLSASQFPTLVHGDAKVANFCFSEDPNKVAAVDFQYVGGGCGMKDVAYFLGSCLSEDECREREHENLDHYFACLRKQVDLRHGQQIGQAMEREYRELFKWAWADFHRFMVGWCPTHTKLTDYSQQLVETVLDELQT